MPMKRKKRRVHRAKTVSLSGQFPGLLLRLYPGGRLEVSDGECMRTVGGRESRVTVRPRDRAGASAPPHQG